MTTMQDHISLVGGHGSDIPTDETGEVLGGTVVHPISRPRPTRYDTAHATASVTLSEAGDTQYSVSIINYTSGVVLGSLSGVTGDLSGEYIGVELGNVADGDVVGVGIDVTEASGVDGSTADVTATLVLEGTV